MYSQVASWKEFTQAHAGRLGLFLLSAATLTFEINLTRLFSVAQFYHFAFMIVSIALLGFGASGTFLAIFPKFGRASPSNSLGWFSVGAGFTFLISFLISNWLPFDSFSIAWDPKQVGILVLNYLAFSAPFFFTGLAVGLILATHPHQAGSTYAVNLMGSATGCVIALVAPSFLGGEGVVVLCTAMAALAGLVSFDKRGKPLKPVVAGTLMVLAIINLGYQIAVGSAPSWLELYISPYKGLSYTLQYPDAEVIYRRWNAFSRVDLVRSSGIRSLPGLSYRFLKPPPAEDGLLVDGDELSPVVLPGYTTGFFDYLPGAVVYKLIPDASVLTLEPLGGLDILTALSLGAARVTAVELNPLVVQAAGNVYQHPRLSVVIDSGRSFTRRSQTPYDIIVVSLANSFHPVRSGAYSLSEDYRYTVEAFQDALSLLNENGILVATRWIQNPPSESLRAFAIAATALENLGGDPGEQIAAFRGYNTITLLVKKSPFTLHDLRIIREFTSDRAFDLVFLQGLKKTEANRHNILPEPLYYLGFKELLNSQPREAYYSAYPFEISPPTDDRPFFSHFFKWSQAPQILAELGKTWQPFGGAGYFVVLALLALAAFTSAILILLPAAFAGRRNFRIQRFEHQTQSRKPAAYLIYFSLIGFAFLLVEIPLIQRFILFLGHPAYSLTVVLFTILLFSGIGSQLSSRLPLIPCLGVLILLLVTAPALLPVLFNLSLGYPLAFRVVLSILILAPIGFLMGVPFPGGIRWLLGGMESSLSIPWIWSVNGASSVIASVLAALFALSIGFYWVFRIGALCYGGAWLFIYLDDRFRNIAGQMP